MKIAIVGSCTFNDYAAIKKFITESASANGIEITEVLSEGARGADYCGAMFLTATGGNVEQHTLKV